MTRDSDQNQRYPLERPYAELINELRANTNAKKAATEWPSKLKSGKNRDWSKSSRDEAGPATATQPLSDMHKIACVQLENREDRLEKRAGPRNKVTARRRRERGSEAVRPGSEASRQAQPAAATRGARERSQRDRRRAETARLEKSGKARGLQAGAQGGEVEAKNASLQSRRRRAAQAAGRSRNGGAGTGRARGKRLAKSSQARGGPRGARAPGESTARQSRAKVNGVERAGSRVGSGAPRTAEQSIEERPGHPEVEDRRRHAWSAMNECDARTKGAQSANWGRAWRTLKAMGSMRRPGGVVHVEQGSRRVCIIPAVDETEEAMR